MPCVPCKPALGQLNHLHLFPRYDNSCLHAFAFKDSIPVLNPITISRLLKQNIRENLCSAPLEPFELTREKGIPSTWKLILFLNSKLELNFEQVRAPQTNKQTNKRLSSQCLSFKFA